MKLKKDTADLFIPDGGGVEQALARTTHLAVGAHQDDIEIMAYHGILECLDAPDRWFTGVTCTRSGSPRSSIYAQFSDEEMFAVRREEQKQAAVIGRYSAMLQLDYTSSEVKDPQAVDIVSDLTAILAVAGPRVVYTHNPCDKHETHVAVAIALLQAVRELAPAARPERLYGCEVWRGLDWFPDEDKVAWSVGGRDNIAAALLGVYDSQIAGGKRYDLGTIGRRRANATYFASHGVDEAAELIFAIDLTPLVQDDSLDICDFVLQYIEKFRADVEAKVRRRAAPPR